MAIAIVLVPEQLALRTCSGIRTVWELLRTIREMLGTVHEKFGTVWEMFETVWEMFRNHKNLTLVMSVFLQNQDTHDIDVEPHLKKFKNFCPKC